MTTPARTPPPLPGLQPEWSRIVVIADEQGTSSGVHVLDRGPADAELTVLCVHGNPTWSYLWRGVLEHAPKNVRVVAIDQVGMGYSARTGRMRRLDQRIHDLDSIVGALDISGRIVLMAHDWGGPVALGWAGSMVDPTDRLAGIVLTNTAVHQPRNAPMPRLIAIAKTPALRDTVCVHTTTFLRGTTTISSVDRSTAAAFRAPYATAQLRRPIGDFVADIPVREDHPSMGTLQEIARGLGALSEVPTLLVWGMRDPVFSPRYLDDLRRRMPWAQVQQYSDAGHLVLEDRPDAIAGIWEWIGDQRADQVSPQPIRAGSASEELSPTRRLHELRDRSTPAITTREGEQWRSISWSLLEDRVRRLAQGFLGRGIMRGDRVSVLIPPGGDLLAVVYALWHIGATVVVIDAAHRPPAMISALRGARIDHLIAIRRAMPIVAAVRVPGRVIWRDQLSEYLASDAAPDLDPPVGPDADAVIVFTSGATGAAKPVAYSWARLAATARLLRDSYSLDESDVLVAAFAPWAVMGPLVGMPSVIPQMDASRPGTLTAQALGGAIDHAGGTVMWASPAALRSVLASAPLGSAERVELMARTQTLRLLLIAGAPVSRSLVREVGECWPNVDLRTPYGMTEVLPATDVTGQEILAAPDAGGVMVGRPLPGVEVAIAELDHEGNPSAELAFEPGVLGEVALRADHAKSRYDARAFVERAASRNLGWHRTGDIGRVDAHGLLRIEGRLAHVITTAAGPVGPVSIEQQVEATVHDQGLQAAAVGIGPAGTQVVVVVLAPQNAKGRRSRMRLADVELINRVRAVVPTTAAVLWRDAMPVDIRHGAKVDRSHLAAQADRFLAGRR